MRDSIKRFDFIALVKAEDEKDTLKKNLVKKVRCKS